MGEPEACPQEAWVSGHFCRLYSISTPFPPLLNRVGVASKENHSVLAAKMQKSSVGRWFFFYKGTVPVSPDVLFTVLLMGQLRFSTDFLSIPVKRRNEIKIPLSFDALSAVGSS